MNSPTGTAPRVTMADIEASIAHTHYFTAAQGVAGEGSAIVWRKELGMLTFCVLVLDNGFTVTGESACVSAENFDAQIGRDIARANAIEKMWPLMGFALKQRLHTQSCASAVLPKTIGTVELGSEAAKTGNW